MTLDFLGDPNVITRFLISEKEMQQSEDQGNISEKTWRNHTPNQRTQAVFRSWKKQGNRFSTRVSGIKQPADNLIIF